jgi:hypothetical protein
MEPNIENGTLYPSKPATFNVGGIGACDTSIDDAGTMMTEYPSRDGCGIEGDCCLMISLLLCTMTFKVGISKGACRWIIPIQAQDTSHGRFERQAMADM